MREKVLDHGYVELVDVWGSDQSVIEDARMSTGKGFQGWGPNQCECIDVKWHPKQAWPMTNPQCSKCGGTGQVPGDEKLLRFLHTKKHTTPFEGAGMKVEVMAPIMVFREWHRHRTQSYNEMSARYTPLPDVNYVPTVERCMLNSTINKQAGRAAGADELTENNAADWLHELIKFYDTTEKLYQCGLEIGIPKELARVILPVGRYSRMRASANLLNWLRFLGLRMPSDAQYEIRQFANAVGRLVETNFPRTWELFAETLRD